MIKYQITHNRFICDSLDTSRPNYIRVVYFTVDALCDESLVSVRRHHAFKLPDMGNSEDAVFTVYERLSPAQVDQWIYEHAEWPKLRSIIDQMIVAQREISSLDANINSSNCRIISSVGQTYSLRPIWNSGISNQRQQQ